MELLKLSLAKLLCPFTPTWNIVYNFSEIGWLCRLFQEVDNIIADIAMNVGQQVLTVNHFLAEMTKFTEIQSQIDATRERIAGLDTSCTELEDKLVLLEDVCNEMQQNNSKFEHEYQLRKYRERKHLELEQVKGRYESCACCLDSILPSTI